jgi:HCOMODA/2-hydroxy-3-carboxy-muconic semialdehyde decarboxylase
MSVVHAHAEETLPFGITKDNKTPIRPVIHSGSFLGANIPIWDIHDHFGDTNLLVGNVAQGRSLAKHLDQGNVALMACHGFAAAGRSIIEVVRISVYLPRNARVMLNARQLGSDLRYLTDGEIAARNSGYSPYSSETWRAWEYWANQAGVGKMLHKPDGV